MLNPEESDTLAATTRVLRIIVGVMTAGLLFFLAVATFVGAPPGRRAGAPQQQRPEALPVISVIAFVGAATVVPLALVVPGIVVDSARKAIAAGTWRPAQGPTAPAPDAPGATDAQKLTQVYVTRTIVGAALTEGAAFLAIMAYFLEGKPYALALAVALIAGVALWFPRPGSAEAWVEDQVERLDSQRHAMP